MKVIKTLKELLKEHNLETISGFGRDWEEMEYLYVPNNHGPFSDREEKFDRYSFVLRQNKVLVSKDNIGTFQCRFVPWKGEDPTEMHFNYEYIG